MKTLIVRNRIITSLKNLFQKITRIFVVLYIIAIDARRGNIHNIEAGVVPIASGLVNVARIGNISLSIFFLSDEFASTGISHVNCIDNA